MTTSNWWFLVPLFVLFFPFYLWLCVRLVATAWTLGAAAATRYILKKDSKNGDES